MLDRTVAISRKVKNPIIAITMDDLITSASPGEELHTKTPNEIIKAIVTPLLNPARISFLTTRSQAGIVTSCDYCSRITRYPRYDRQMNRQDRKYRWITHQNITFLQNVLYKRSGIQYIFKLSSIKKNSINLYNYISASNQSGG